MLSAFGGHSCMHTETPINVKSELMSLSLAKEEVVNILKNYVFRPSMISYEKIASSPSNAILGSSDGDGRKSWSLMKDISELNRFGTVHIQLCNVVVKLSDPTALRFQWIVELCSYLHCPLRQREGYCCFHQGYFNRCKGSLPVCYWLEGLAAPIPYQWSQVQSNCDVMIKLRSTSWQETDPFQIPEQCQAPGAKKAFLVTA